MSAGGLYVRRTAGERLAAWLLTGPLGHLLGFLADASLLWVAWVRGEARRRLAEGRRSLGARVRR